MAHPFNKRAFLFDKSTSPNPEGQVEIKSPSPEILFDTNDKKSKSALFNKVSDLWTLYLSKTGPDISNVFNFCIVHYFKQQY